MLPGPGGPARGWLFGPSLAGLPAPASMYCMAISCSWSQAHTDWHHAMNPCYPQQSQTLPASLPSPSLFSVLYRPGNTSSRQGQATGCRTRHTAQMHACTCYQTSEKRTCALRKGRDRWNRAPSALSAQRRWRSSCMHTTRRHRQSSHALNATCSTTSGCHARLKGSGCGTGSGLPHSHLCS